jgi:hypothetical protein
VLDEQVIKNLHRNLALPLLRGFARVANWNDQRVVDGVVDNSAAAVLRLGDHMRVFMQPGILSRYIARTLTVLAGIALLALYLR